MSPKKKKSDRPTILTPELEAFLEVYLQKRGPRDEEAELHFNDGSPVLFEVYEESGFEWLFVDAEKYPDGTWLFDVGFGNYWEELAYSVEELDEINADLIYPLQVRLWNTGKTVGEFLSEWKREEEEREAAEKAEAEKAAAEKAAAEREAAAARAANPPVRIKNFAIPDTAVAFTIGSDEEYQDAIEEDPCFDEAYYGEVYIGTVEGLQLSLSPIRIVIPDLDISIREGLARTSRYPDDEWDVIAVYAVDERNPWDVDSCYSNISRQSFLLSCARQRGFDEEQAKSLICYADKAEFELPEELAEKYEVDDSSVRVFLPPLAFVKKGKNPFPDEAAELLEAYLFEGMSFRQLETELLGIDKEKADGKRSEKAVKLFGLTAKHKGIFADCSLPLALASMEAAGDGYRVVIAALDPDA